MQRVVDAQVGEDVEVVLRFVAAHDERVGFKDGMRGVDSGVRNGEVHRLGRGVANDKCNDNAEQKKCNEHRRKKIPMCVLFEF
jgi:hypothetical protein